MSFLLYSSSSSSTFRWQPHVDTVSLSLGQERLRFLGNSLALGISREPEGAPPFFLQLRMWKMLLAVGSEVGQILIESKGAVLQLDGLGAVLKGRGC